MPGKSPENISINIDSTHSWTYIILCIIFQYLSPCAIGIHYPVSRDHFNGYVSEENHLEEKMESVCCCSWENQTHKYLYTVL